MECDIDGSGMSMDRNSLTLTGEKMSDTRALTCMSGCLSVTAQLNVPVPFFI